MIKKLIKELHDYYDNELSIKIVERLYSKDKNEWLGIGHTFNAWEFPIGFYDLIPKWWKTGSSVERASKVIRPAMRIIKKEFGDKEELRYHNVSCGRMSDEQFEYWYSIKDDELLIDRYYKNFFKMEEIHWWEDKVWKKLCDSNVWNEEIKELL